ncbi:hypothetical protein FHG87_001231 [Trinorchestia longiramus]|nr:hypothetical protein FHG87_001231 [Trinorchestia longiramus]
MFAPTSPLLSNITAALQHHRCSPTSPLLSNITAVLQHHRCSSTSPLFSNITTALNIKYFISNIVYFAAIFLIRYFLLPSISLSLRLISEATKDFYWLLLRKKLQAATAFDDNFGDFSSSEGSCTNTPDNSNFLESNYRGRLTHQQSTTSRHSLPASAHHFSRHRTFKLRSDSLSQHPKRHHHLHHHHQLQHYHPFCRKARSAENLRNCRMSFNHSFDDPPENHRNSGSGATNIIYSSSYNSKKTPYRRSVSMAENDPKLVPSGSSCHSTSGGAKKKWARYVNYSLENCRGASLPQETRTPLLLETGVRGKSLDSGSTASARRLADGRVTPELRVSPPPPSPKEPNSPRPRSAKVYFTYMSKYKNQSLDYPSSYSSAYSSPTSANSASYLSKYGNSPQATQQSYTTKYGSSSATTNPAKEASSGRSSGIPPGRQFGLQRQEPIEETLFPPHYPTLVEEQEDDPMLGSNDKEIVNDQSDCPEIKSTGNDDSLEMSGNDAVNCSVCADSVPCEDSNSHHAEHNTDPTSKPQTIQPKQAVEHKAPKPKLLKAASVSFKCDSGLSESPISPMEKLSDDVKTANADGPDRSCVVTSECFSKWSVPRPTGGVEEMLGGGRRVRLEWGAYITV